MKFGFTAASVGLVLLMGTSTQASDTAFSFTAAPGGWVAGGRTSYAISPAAGWTFSASGTGYGTVRLSANRVGGGASTNYTDYYWNLDLKAPNGGRLLPGAYEGATREPFSGPDEPGLNLVGNHRGNNIVAGRFDVLEAGYGASGLVERFSVNFTQYDEGSPNQWIVGSFRYNATVPEPAAAAVAVGALTVIARRRRAR